jgi:hypothetical protein
MYLALQYRVVSFVNIPYISQLTLRKRRNRGEEKMAKAVKYSKVAEELKKDYLREHLESVKVLIRTWMSELHPPEPLAPIEQVWGWQSLYRSTSQDNPDENHMLRRHLKSRALWSHYSSWERKLEEIWQLTKQVRVEAKTREENQSANTPWRYSAEYLPLALWKAFDIALGKITDLPFKVPDAQVGLSYGAYRIEETVNTLEDRLFIEGEYREFIRSLSQIQTMKQLTNSWLEAGQLEVQITTIADKILKSGDIFYVCRFCRHLWK